jgi:hypothetical protein
MYSDILAGKLVVHGAREDPEAIVAGCWTPSRKLLELIAAEKSLLEETLASS